MPDSSCYQGQQLINIPERPGLYSWYYKPVSVSLSSIKKVLSSLLDVRSSVTTTVNLRYGMSFRGQCELSLSHGARKKNSNELADNVLDFADNFFFEVFSSERLELFARPIYIGIAKNLNTRIYKQHFVNLTEMWDEKSPVSKFLAQNDSATVEEVMAGLQMPHSFALETRVRRIPPRDLAVHVFYTQNLPPDIEDLDDEIDENDRASRRRLEKILQILSDPVCGRR